MFTPTKVAAAMLLGAAVLPQVASANAPTDRAVPAIFSSRSTNAFSFMMSTQPGEIFYVPKSGGVRLDGDLSNPVPEFAASTVLGTWIPFLNKPLTSIGGTLTTSNHLADFDIMAKEAKTAGYTVTPSPVETSNTKVTLLGIPDAGTGRVNARCTEQSFTVQDTDEDGNPITNPDGTPKLIVVKVPVCYIADPRDPTKEIRTDVFIDFNSIDVSSSTVDADYSFQGIVHPSNANLVKNKLRTGARWDDLLKVAIDWTITQEQTPRYAEVEVNWKSVFTQLWTKAAIHNFACIDVQFEALVRDIVTCDGQANCGVKVHWFDDNGNELPPHVVPPGAQFGDLVNGIVQKLRDELAQTIQPQLGDPGDVNSSSAIFVFKGNFQKISVERHEIIPVYYFPKAKTIKKATTMGVGCLKGDVDQLVLWNMATPACKSMLQESNLGPGGQGS